MTQPDITVAVPTEYAGTTFRSRLEADWARTLNAYGITWTYEPETITLPSGTVYIPDFWLPLLNTWIEVKGPGIPRTEKTAELARTRPGQLVILGRKALPSTGDETGRRPSCGYLNWETPYGPSAYITSCPECDRTQWITLRRPWSCRVCRCSLEENLLHRAVDRRFRFVEGPTFGQWAGAL